MLDELWILQNRMNRMKGNIKKEACVSSLAEAIEAERRGADQIELCSHLELDGLTPAASLIQECMSQLSIPVKVMVRPKAGSFVCDVLDLGNLVTDIKMMKNLGVAHIVLGVITPNSEVDIEALKLLMEHTKDMSITFHKAIDLCIDPVREVKRLIELQGIHSILTSGGSSTAIEGIPTLKQMSQTSGEKIQIIPAGNITDLNLNSIHKELQLPLYHGRKIVGDLNKRQ